MTNSELEAQKTLLLEMLGKPEELRKADGAVRFRSAGDIVKAIQEIERQQAVLAAPASTTAGMASFGKVNRAW